MFKGKITIFIILFILGLFLSNKAFAISDYFLNVSLKWQNFLQNLKEKILPQKDDNIYKEKYYQLLQEIAQLKLLLNQIKESNLVIQREKYLPNLIELEILKIDPLGYIYLDFNKNINENSIFLDKNWNLAGITEKITKNYVIVKSLNAAGLEFNVANLDGKLLGLGRTLSNGFLEVNFIDPNIEIKENDFVLTYGDDNFPPGLLIGVVKKIIKNKKEQRIVVELTFDLSNRKIYLLK
jgi:cell shape-determining protein MreC